MNAKTIKVRGIVQGVGFRPTVFRLAEGMGIKGFVKNDGQGVTIHIEGEAVGRFLEVLIESLPPEASVSSITAEDSAFEGFAEFSILESEKGGLYPAPISPDLAVCGDCLRELCDPTDRRFEYPFINCTNCGPRYSIIREVPYDRVSTTMSVFPMCPDCQSEYNDPRDRRFHAQPNACEVCGPKYTLLDSTGDPISTDNPILEAARLIERGKIVAMKGIGGFHLLANAFDEGAVSALRMRKSRPSKPFAIMVRDLETARGFFLVNDDEARELRSPQAPIILVKKQTSFPESIAPGLDRVGVFLPYAPAHHLLFKYLSVSAIIATSGNRRDEPIVSDNDEAVRDLAGIADCFLVHNREIVGRCDDSVAFLFEGAKVLLRRSRGFVPRAIELPIEGPPVLAVGADLKGAFCVTRGNEAFLSPYLGDLRGPKSSDFFDEVLDRYLEWLDIRPRIVIADLHPDYISTIKGEELARRFGVPFLQIQHHFAHGLSVLAEQPACAAPALAIALDGHGFGPDGTIWGGEFLTLNHSEFARAGHISTVPQLGGDLAAVDAGRMSLSWLYKTFGDSARAISGKLLPPMKLDMAVIERLIAEDRPPLTSSAGRLFDTFAAISQICFKNSFEGECPQRLMAEFDPSIEGGYDFAVEGGILDPRPAIVRAVEDVLRGESGSAVATRFHRGFASALAEVAADVCRDSGICDVILTGGVFQSVVLLELTSKALRERGLKPFINRAVSPGDEGIALGQALFGVNRLVNG